MRRESGHEPPSRSSADAAAQPQQPQPGKRTRSEAWPAAPPGAPGRAAATPSRDGSSTAGPSAPGARPSLQTLFGRPPVVQRSPVSTTGGTFNDEYFAETSSDGQAVDGVDMYMTFTPQDPANATKIGLVQSVKHVVEGQPFAVDPTKRNQMAADGTVIDKQSNTRNPLYATAAPGLHGADRLETYATEPVVHKQQPAQSPSSQQGPQPRWPASEQRHTGFGKHGHRYFDGSWHTEAADLHDAPNSPAKPGAQMTFETTALAIEGAQKGAYYGSVSWGLAANQQGEIHKVGMQKASDTQPTAAFRAAGKRWNESRTQGTLEVTQPTELYNAERTSHPMSADSKDKHNADASDNQNADSEEEAIMLPPGTIVLQEGTELSGEGVPLLKVKVDPHDPTYGNYVGYVETRHVKDNGNGEDTVKLPGMG
jgi:hypothetical protein